MKTWTTTRASMLRIVLLSVMMAMQAAAQTPQSAHPQKAAQNRAAVESNPGCQRIIEECQKLGFIVGQWKKDNGLWKDCFDPVVRGGSPTRDGKPIQVPVSSSDVQSCRAAAVHHPPQP